MLPLLCLAAIPSGSFAPLSLFPATPPHAATAADAGRYGLLTPFVLGAEPLPAPILVDPHDGDDEHYAPNLYRQFTLSAGVAAYDNFDTTMRVSGNVLGASLDLEDFLGVDESDTIARFDAHYSFNRRHRVDLSYYDIRRSGTRVIAEDIQVGDTTIPAGTIDTVFNTQIFKLAYRYNFVADYRTVIGASLGAHLMGLELGLSNSAFAVEEDFKAAAPLPLLGLHAGYALSDKWSLNGSVEFLQFDIDAYRGFISDTRLTIEHDTFDNFGWGVGFNGFTVDGSIENDSGSLKADIEYGYQGLMLYFRFYF